LGIIAGTTNSCLYHLPCINPLHRLLNAPLAISPLTISPLATATTGPHWLAGLGDGEDVVGAGDVGEAAEVGGVGKLGLAGGELLVAAGSNRERIAGRDG
jgi:hypothetical protein